MAIVVAPSGITVTVEMGMPAAAQLLENIHALFRLEGLRFGL